MYPSRPHGDASCFGEKVTPTTRVISKKYKILEQLVHQARKASSRGSSTSRPAHQAKPSHLRRSDASPCKTQARCVLLPVKTISTRTRLQRLSWYKTKVKRLKKKALPLIKKVPRKYQPSASSRLRRAHSLRKSSLQQLMSTIQTVPIQRLGTSKTKCST